MPLPFLPDQFLEEYAEVNPQFLQYDANTLNNLYYSEALVLGSSLLNISQIGASANPDVKNYGWDASTNTPTLENGTIQGIGLYICTKAGTVDFGDGNITFKKYNQVQYNTSFNIWHNIGYPRYYQWSCVVLAHILLLYLNPSSVGRVESATEGSVSGGRFAYVDTLSSTWWNQTQYGAMCWQEIKKNGGATIFPAYAYNGYIV